MSTVLATLLAIEAESPKAPLPPCIDLPVCPSSGAETFCACED